MRTEAAYFLSTRPATRHGPRLLEGGWDPVCLEEKDDSRPDLDGLPGAMTFRTFGAAMRHGEDLQDRIENIEFRITCGHDAVIFTVPPGHSEHREGAPMCRYPISYPSPENRRAYS